MINALQKTLKRSQYMQNMLCFGVFVGQDASNISHDSKINQLLQIIKFKLSPLERGTSEIRGLQISYNKTSKMPNSNCKQSSGMTAFVFSGMTGLLSGMTIKDWLKGGCYGS